MSINRKETDPHSPSNPLILSEGHYYFGLTKREEFAKAAMQGILADERVDLTTPKHYSTVADQAVQMADALIEILNR